MTLKRYNLYQLSQGILQGYYIGCVLATSYQMIGNAALFSIGDEHICTMNFVRVEEIENDET